MKTHRLAGTYYDYFSDAYLAALQMDFPDITAGLYDGDFSKSLEWAQRDKHEWVLAGIGFQAGQRILDIGCGWGPMLNAIRKRGGRGIGITLSQKQVEYCRARGLEVSFADWKDADMSGYPAFDGIVSIGAFEHLCSSEEYRRGEQEEIYRQFFAFCHNCLKPRGKRYLRTMTWGYKVPHGSEINPDAPDATRYHDRVRGVILGMSSWWPPASEEQLVSAAKPYFELLRSNDGRCDYGQTFFEWKRRRIALPALKRATLLLRQVLAYSKDADFRRSCKHVRAAIRHGYFREAFLQNVLGHSRIFFQNSAS